MEFDHFTTAKIPPVLVNLVYSVKVAQGVCGSIYVFGLDRACGTLRSASVFGAHMAWRFVWFG